MNGHTLVVAAARATAFALLAFAALQAAEPASSPPATPSPPAAGGGLIAVVDPAVADLASDPGWIRAVLADPALREALSTSSAGLIEELSASGGTLVRLEGRFQNAVVAVVDASGAVHLGHAPAPGAAPRAELRGPVCTEGALATEVGHAR